MKTLIAKLALVGILGTAYVTFANHAFAEGTYNFEYGVGDQEWIVLGDTWIRRDEPTNSAYGGPIRALGSHLGCLTAKRFSGHGWRVRTLGRKSFSNSYWLVPALSGPPSSPDFKTRDGQR